MLLLALPVLAVLLIAFEAVARLPFVDSQVPAPDLGSANYSLEIKLHLLDEMSAEEPFDCILVGSSMVRSGLIPAVVEEAYQDQTGEAIRCFNFGVLGLMASGVDYIIDYVLRHYQPRLIVYGMSPRGFARTEEDRFDGEDVAGLDWMQYRLGSFNLAGWLRHHLRFSKTFGIWLFETQVDRLDQRRTVEDTVTPGRGFAPLEGVLPYPVPPGEGLANRIEIYFADYHMNPAEVDALERILRYHQPPRTQLVLAEVPLHPTVLDTYLEPDRYEVFNARVQAYTAAAGVLYWPTTLESLIPIDGWYNLYHLNPGGARVYSRWLGEQLGAAVVAGRLDRIAVPR